MDTPSVLRPFICTFTLTATTNQQQQPLKSTMITKIANFISVLGHPLLTVSLFSILSLFNFESIGKASLISAIIIGVVIIPTTIKMYRGKKSGVYTNFDVSDKVERQSWYKYVLTLLFAVTLILFLTDQSLTLRLSVLFFFLLLLTSQIVNNFIKSSLHVSFNVFISFLILPMNLIIGALLFVFVLIIAWARLTLKRHTLKEIIVGAFIGLFWGFGSLFTISGYAQKMLRSTVYHYSIPVELKDGIGIGNLSEEKMDSFKIMELTTLILKDSYPNIHSLLIVRNNKLVYENYFAGTDEISGQKLGYIKHTMDDLHDVRSISKSVTSACVGIAIKQGLIKNIDEPIFQYFKNYETYFDTTKKKITIRHLLTMTSGLEWNEDISYRDPRNSELQMDVSSDPVKYILSRNSTHQPGSHWNYNGGETQLLAEIIKAVCGENVALFAEKNLFKPMGIEKYEWLPLKKNTPAAASGLRLRPRDLLKIGLLYVEDGNWKNTSIIQSDWAKQSLITQVLRPQSKNNGGYGYQFWTYTDTLNSQPFHITEAKGNGGQRLFFCKQQNLLVLFTAGNYNQWNIENDTHKALTNYILKSIVE